MRKFQILQVKITTGSHVSSARASVQREKAAKGRTGPGLVLNSGSGWRLVPVTRGKIWWLNRTKKKQKMRAWRSGACLMRTKLTGHAFQSLTYKLGYLRAIPRGQNKLCNPITQSHIVQSVTRPALGSKDLVMDLMTVSPWDPHLQDTLTLWPTRKTTWGQRHVFLLQQI